MRTPSRSMSASASTPAWVSRLPAASSAEPSASAVRPKCVNDAMRTPSRNNVSRMPTSMPRASQPSRASTRAIRPSATAPSTSDPLRHSRTTSALPSAIRWAVSIIRSVWRSAPSGRKSSSTKTGSPCTSTPPLCSWPSQRSRKYDACRAGARRAVSINRSLCVSTTRAARCSVAASPGAAAMRHSLASAAEGGDVRPDETGARRCRARTMPADRQPTETARMASTLLIRNGTVVDGTGEPGRRADVLVRDDRIVAVGTVEAEVDADVLDATGQVVSPGFVNVLSHAWGSLQRDPTGASDLLQGVTTEVFGEAFSLGPSDGRLVESLKPWGDLTKSARLEFARLSEGLAYLESQGVAPNIASFVGGHNHRILAAGFDDGPADPKELDRVRGILAEEMQEGALGIGTALISPPGRFAGTDELVSLCEVVGRYDGMYISHMRSEGDQFLECLDELMQIGRRASVRAEVYHLKAAGSANWPKMKLAIEAIGLARESGQPVSADMYPYTAGGTALAASIPPRFHVGGPNALLERLGDPALRKEIAAEMREPSDDFENLFVGAEAGRGILFFEDFSDGTPARGRRLSEIAEERGEDPADALLDIVAREPGQGVAYFMIDEDNVRLGLSQPWVSIGSDAMAHQAIAPFTDTATHPRAYGTFARVLGHYCRDQRLFSLEDAVRRMTSLPADNLRLVDRGRLVPGGFADIAIFDAREINDTATYENPHSYATGIKHVVVNGTPVVRDGALTHATPGRALRRGA